MSGRYSGPRLVGEDYEIKPRRRRSRRRSREVLHTSEPLFIGVGNPSIEGCLQEVPAYSGRDAGAFQQAVAFALRESPPESRSLLIIVNGWRSWLGEIFESCVRPDYLEELRKRNREVQFTDSFHFPEGRAYDDTVTWSFVVEHLNVPEAYWWSIDENPPSRSHLDCIDQYRFRLGVWTCAKGAFRGTDDPQYDGQVAVTVVFTREEVLPPWETNRLLFPLLFPNIIYDVAFFERMQQRDDGITWIFTKLWNFFTDWNNIQRQFEQRLEAAEKDSKDETGPAYIRTRENHKQIDRIYDLQQYLRFQRRSFEKLLKIKNIRREAGEDDPESRDISRALSGKAGNTNMDDAYDDLVQAEYEFDLLIERFKNLSDFEFSLETAKQSADTRFLSYIATVFFPLSFLASIWGMTEFTGTVLLYIYVAVPILVLSLVLAPLVPILTRRYDEWHSAPRLKRPRIKREKVTLLGYELPGNEERIADKEEKRVRRRKSDRRLSTYRKSQV